MSIVCSECHDSVLASSGASISLLRQRKGKLNLVGGYVICFSHVRKFMKKLHRTPESDNGLIFRLNGVMGRKGLFSENIQYSAPTKTLETFGYLSPAEAKKYFPNSYQALCRNKTD